MAGRCEGHDRLESAAAAVANQERLKVVEKAIAELEGERQAWLSEEQKRAEWEWASQQESGRRDGADRDQDEARSR
jgi:hypothetical protein